MTAMRRKMLVALAAMLVAAGCADTPNEAVRRREKCRVLLDMARGRADSTLLLNVAPEPNGFAMPCSYYLTLGGVVEP